MCYENFHAPCGKVSTFFSFFYSRSTSPVFISLSIKQGDCPFYWTWQSDCLVIPENMSTIGMLMSKPIQWYLSQLFSCHGRATILQGGKMFLCCFSRFTAKWDPENRKYGYSWNPYDKPYPGVPFPIT